MSSSPATTKKKVATMSVADIDKTLTRLIKSAVEQWTQWTDDIAARAGCFTRRVIQLKPAAITQFTHAEVMDIIREKMHIAPDNHIIICDTFMTTYPDEIFEKFMSYATMRIVNKYQSEQYDCDDFSLSFASIARQWHARIRAQLECDEHTCAIIPEAPRFVPEAAANAVIPHIPATAAAPNAANHYIGGSPIGMCHGRTSAGAEQHAFNFWISSAREVFFIEPQTGEFIVLGDGASINVVYI
jgi:hypothetical protein